MVGFLRGWHHDGCDRTVVVDKNDAWLASLEMLLALAPEAKLIVCLRDLGQIYGSIEARQRKSMSFDPDDPVARYYHFRRTGTAFARNDRVGEMLRLVRAVPDLPPAVRERVFLLRFEDLAVHLTACMSDIFQWLELSPYAVDPERIFSEQPALHDVPPSIQARIEDDFAWYYRRFNY
jgi:sulfotransferase